ncbi:TRAP transporter substrate-binding protein [Thalassobacillus pellis]|uniref:TRAP transporter substrate-binding protein n=1 Tax=Thalassobacillus pellis TaxID=748008 RepID=UPI001960A7A3|nr:TRAP transporter substrate-binding protein [Thalassobacillus pellis]MBM7553594.1 tripartite ATP-independent transporter DctP family solute receptor [Thalassobacillus pellis]
MKISKLFLVVFAMTVFSLLVGCSSGSGETKDSVTLSFAYELPEDHPWGKGAQKFKEIVEEKTNGEIKIELYGNGQLGGSGREIQEGAKVGTIDIGISSTPMAQLNPYLNIFSLPYIFENREHAWEVLDGPIGDEVGKKLEEHNLKHLAYWEDGFRQVTNSVRPITSPEDFDGLKIRVPESDVRLQTFKALGASPLPMSWSEVFTSLQQGTIDGQENPLSVIESASFYDVQKYLTITNHVYSPATLFMNKSKWDSLTEEQQKIIKEAAEAGRDVNRELNEKQDNQLIKGLKEKGMEVTVIEDITPFQEATKPVWDMVINELGSDAKELIEKINQK